MVLPPDPRILLGSTVKLSAGTSQCSLRPSCRILPWMQEISHSEFTNICIYTLPHFWYADYVFLKIKTLRTYYIVFTVYSKKTLDPNWSMTFCRINFSNQRINSWSFHWDQLSQGSPRLFWLATIKNHSCPPSHGHQWEVTKQGIVFGVWSLAFLDIDLKKRGLLLLYTFINLLK